MIKEITLGITLVFSTLMFASPAYADWEEVSGNVAVTVYVDFDRIRTNGRYVYWWHLSDYLEPSPAGKLSSKVYNQGDCEIFRYKRLSFSFHKQPMGEGSGEIDSIPDTEWNYPSPNSTSEVLLKQVCDYAENL